MPVPPELLEMIEAFLAEQRHNPRGEATVSEDEYKQLNDIIRLLVIEKFHPGPNGARPIEWQLVSRSTHQSLGYMPLPYDQWVLKHLAEAYAEFDTAGTHALAKLARTDPVRFDMMRLRIAKLNYGIAQRDLEVATDSVLNGVEKLLPPAATPAAASTPSTGTNPRKTSAKKKPRRRK